MIDHFFTISNHGQGVYKEKGSKFLAFAFQVSNEVSIQEKIAALKKEYYDARHFCYGYILGNDSKRFRANDDGEPNHSAGDPILGQIRSFNLTNTLVVVVRYFGGTKLGVSGLITAYKSASEEALKSTKIVKQFITTSIDVSYPYSCTNEVMKLIDKFELVIIDQNFAEKCTLNANVIISKYAMLEKDLQLLIDTRNDIIFSKIKKTKPI